ncbi:MAG: GNAT family N-acetyltransferase [Bacteroidales bacterium]|jgi:GNAT superfamily N-acetyltransferase
MEINIREMRVEDAGSVAKLSGQFGYPSTEEETNKRMLLLKEFPDNRGFVAVHNNEIIGWIHVMLSARIESSPFYEISGLVVDERYRGQGIGAQLVDEVKSWCKGKRINKLRVRCNVTRTRTHEFYLRLGFNETKISKIFDMDIYPHSS